MPATRLFLRAGALAAAGLSLAACGTVSDLSPQPTYPVSQAIPATVTKPGARQQQAQGRVDGRPLTGTNKPYEVAGVWYTPSDQPGYDQTGLASWYGDAFDGKATADGEIFDMNGVSAAHKTLPLPSIVEVTNLDNGRSIRVRLNDRGPFVDGRIIDLSRGAAEQLGMLQVGVAHVRVRYIGPADGVFDNKPGLELASAVVPAPKTSTAATPPRAYKRAAQPPAPVVVAAAPAPQPIPQAASSPPPAQPQLASYSVGADRVSGFGPALAIAPVGLWSVQAGTYADLAAAEAAARGLTTAGAPLIHLVRQGGEVVYAVVIGAADQPTAAALLARVAAKGFTSARILQP